MANYYNYMSRCSELTGFPSPTEYTTIRITDEPTILSGALSQGYLPKSSPIQIHTVYAAVRSNAIDVGYVVGGMTDPMTEYAFEETASDFGYTGTFTAYNSPSVSQIEYEIDCGRPVQLRVGGDVYYGNHGMIITGYVLEEATANIGGLVAVFDVFCVSVFDCWSESERWYDMTELSNVGSLYSRADAQTIATLCLS